MTIIKINAITVPATTAMSWLADSPHAPARSTTS